MKLKSESKIDMKKMEIAKILDEKLSKIASKENIEELKQMIRDQAKGIKVLSDTVNSNVKEMNSLKDQNAILSSAIEHHKVSSDNQEQYSRRSCFRINGVPKETNVNAEQCLEKVKKICNELNVAVPDNCFERAHRGERERKSIIVKFTSFKYRTMMCRKQKGL